MAIAHHGTLRRCLAAVTYAGSGFGGLGCCGRRVRRVRAGGPRRCGGGCRRGRGGRCGRCSEAAAASLAHRRRRHPGRSRRAARATASAGVRGSQSLAEDRCPRARTGNLRRIDRAVHLRTTSRARDLRARLRTTWSDDYSSLANVPARRLDRSSDLRSRLGTAHRSTTTGITAPMIAIDHLEWPGINQAFIVVVHRGRSG